MSVTYCHAEPPSAPWTGRSVYCDMNVGNELVGRSVNHTGPIVKEPTVIDGTRIMAELSVPTSACGTTSQVGCLARHF